MNLVFDENFGKPIVTALSGLVFFEPDSTQITHLFDIAPSGTPDDVWVPQLIAQRDAAIVFSTDRGKKNDGQKLPLICVQHGIRHVLLSASIHKLKQFDKIRLILFVWPEVKQLLALPNGARMKLQLRGDRPILVDGSLTNRA